MHAVNINSIMIDATSSVKSGEDSEMDVATEHGPPPELTASSSSDCSPLTEKEMEFEHKDAPFQLDTSCGGLEIRVGLVDKELGAVLSKKAQELRSSVASTAHSVESAVLSTLGLEPQVQAEETSYSRTTTEPEIESSNVNSMNMVRILLSAKSQELGSVVASKLQTLYSSVLSREGESSLLSCAAEHDGTHQHEKAHVQRPTTSDVPWE